MVSSSRRRLTNSYSHQTVMTLWEKMLNHTLWFQRVCTRLVSLFLDWTIHHVTWFLHGLSYFPTPPPSHPVQRYPDNRRTNIFIRTSTQLRRTNRPSIGVSLLLLANSDLAMHTPFPLTVLCRHASHLATSSLRLVFRLGTYLVNDYQDMRRKTEENPCSPARSSLRQNQR